MTTARPKRESMRILMVCPQFAPLIGGYERAAARVSSALAARGHQVTVVTERRHPDWPAFERTDGYSIVRLPCLFHRGVHLLSSQLALTRWIAAQRRFDVVHIHQYGPTSIGPISIARLVGTPCVLKLTSTGSLGIVNVKRGCWDRLSVTLEKTVAACVATTEGGREEAVSFGIPAERVHVIPNGIDTGRWRPAADAERLALRQRLGLPLDRTVAIHVGRLASAKNILSLLTSWRKLASSNTAVPMLRIIGDGPEKERIAALISRLDLDHAVTLVGTVSDPLPWYQAADFIVLASPSEGLSNSLIEGLSCGLPFVSSAGAVPAEVFDGYTPGATAPSAADDAYVRALSTASLSILWRRACAKDARRVAVSRFDIDGNVDRLAALYATL